MIDQPEQVSNGGDDDDPGGTPRWAKVFGIILIALLVPFVILQLTGEHGPARHMP